MNGILNVAATIAALAKKLAAVDAFARNVSKEPGPAGPRGPQGATGDKGDPGDDGLQGAKGDRGDPGPRGEKGDPGDAGPQGAAGPRGEKGEKGDRGEKGEKGDTGPVPEHEWSGTKLRWKKPDGKWGKYVDLKGEKGPAGKNAGTIVVRSGSGIGSVGVGNEGIEPNGVVVLQGGQLVSLSVAQFTNYVVGSLDMGSNYARRADFVGETIIYRGEAAPGTADTSAAWRIKRIEFSVGGDGKQDVVEKWAGGVDGFVHAWTDRAALEYA